MDKYVGYLLSLVIFVYILVLYRENASIGSVESTVSINTTALGRHLDALKLVSVKKNVDMKKIRVFCWVNTYDKNHETRARAIKETWGKKCDKLVFFSNKMDESLPAVRVVAPATHENLWKKHRQVLKLIYREYYGEYDWFYKVDDDAFVLMENLKSYLASDEIQALPKDKPLLLGHRMTLPWWEMVRPFQPYSDYHPLHIKALQQVRKAYPNGLLYTPGGGGYVLNWAYVKLLTESLDEPYCLPNEVVPDDWAISFCMHFHGVQPYDTRDALKRERIHQYSPARVFHEPHDSEDYDHDVYPSIYYLNNWFSDHNGIGWQNGTNCCAPDTISFHYIKGSMMRQLYSYYYSNN